MGYRYMFNPQTTQLDLKEVYRDSIGRGEGIDLAKLNDVAKIQIDLEERLKKAEESADEIRKELGFVSRELFPELMRSAEITKLEVEGGYRFTLKDGVEAGLENRKRAFEWMEEHGYGDLIDVTVEVKFKAKKEQNAEELYASLAEEYGDAVSLSKGVHAARLKSMMMECAEQNLMVPLEFFKAHYYSEVKVTRKA